MSIAFQPPVITVNAKSTSTRQPTTLSRGQIGVVLILKQKQWRSIDLTISTSGLDSGMLHADVGFDLPLPPFEQTGPGMARKQR